ncbi:head-tail joining protein [Noviherbaspirillum denitrificans]|uniref:Phage tail protein n=1 Tax=Noviherbaspirillum denitrificans TaxID=1968433 RepID=A0A254TB51_9BURK|nr:hypothetical protein [Noviherbaspirillum denitrificans]OWW18413.1 hypothetical protein AYR66_01015 [Noviherbaspirillum denitrificans]OWW19377.1 hypothetical protein AYR66_07500 [Noviherbaspirillum denitrificans]
MFVENTAPFFSDFGVAAMLDGVSVRGIFDNAYSHAGAGVGMAVSNPAFTLGTESVPANPVGKLLIVGSVTYAIAEHHPDGTGMSILLLEETA